jgi:hypothetical protein
VEDHLQEQVAQFLAQVVGTRGVGVLLLDRVEDLVDLLDEMAREAGVGLLGVPWTAAGAAQAGLRGDKVQQRCALRLPERVDRLDLDVLVAEPRSLARPSSASACRRAWATWSASMPCPTSSRSCPAGPLSSATGRTSKATSPTSSAGSEGCSRSST